MPHSVIVDRLWRLYGWPEAIFPMRGMTPEKLCKYKAVSEYVEDFNRLVSDDGGYLDWHYGRMRYFFEEFRAGRTVDPIEIDNVCDRGHIYPIPIVLDGHHRLAGAYLAGARIIPATYGGLVSLRQYLTGRRKTAPPV